MRSLENQTNKNFEIIFILNDKFFDNPKYEFVFLALQNCTSFPIRFSKTHKVGKSMSISSMFKNSDVPSIIINALNDYDFVIQSAMDFDDFIFKNAVADTQDKVNECDSILAYGYCKGYTYLNGEIRNYKASFHGAGHVAILQSLILKSTFAKKLPCIGIYSYVHSKFKLGMKNFFKENNLKFSENMFQQNKKTTAFIYFRTEFSHNNLVTNPGSLERLYPKKPFLTTNEDGLTKEHLKSEFGFEYKLNSIE